MQTRTAYIQHICEEIVDYAQKKSRQRRDIKSR